MSATEAVTQVDVRELVCPMPTMMKSWMEKANLATIPELLEIANELGIRMYACNTTLNVIGVLEEDLIDGVEFADAPAFLDFAGESDVQLFI